MLPWKPGQPALDPSGTQGGPDVQGCRGAPAWSRGGGAHLEPVTTVTADAEQTAKCSGTGVAERACADLKRHVMRVYLFLPFYTFRISAKILSLAFYLLKQSTRTYFEMCLTVDENVNIWMPVGLLPFSLVLLHLVLSPCRVAVGRNVYLSH